jgi:hypothetical protein
VEALPRALIRVRDRHLAPDSSVSSRRASQSVQASSSHKASE